MTPPAAWEVKAGRDFWETLTPLRSKYTREQFVEVVTAVKMCIRELQERGEVDEWGWSDHVLLRAPFDDGLHREFHTFDDDVLVVYLRRERRRMIRMVGVFDHRSIPGG